MEERRVILYTNNLKRNYVTATPDGENIVHHVLKGITLGVREGEFIGIMGSSGCGKTTLLKTLGMMNLPDEGYVKYKGKKTSEIYGDELARLRRQEIAFVFQDYYLLDSLTVRENIMLPLILDEVHYQKGIKRAKQIAGQFGISHLLDKKPYELSGGEKQRTAICRAMISNPQLILADEPTGNLDTQSSAIVIRSLSYINQKLGKTILLVTHDPKVASYCDKILLLKDGVIIDVMKTNGNKKDFYQRIVRKMELL